MQPKEHLLHLDVLKGLAIFLVVLTHLFSFGLGTYSHIVPKSFEAVRMPLFMLIAGYFMASPWPLKRSGQGTFWRKQLVRLLLPLSITPLCYTLCFNHSLDKLLWETKHLGYWFTWVLFEMFLLLYLVRQVNRFANREQRKSIELTILFFSVLGLFSLISQLPTDTKVFSLLSLKELNQYYLYFALGYSLKRLPRVETWIYQDSTSVIALALTLIQIYLALHGYPKLWGSLSLNLSSVIAALGLGKRLTLPEGVMTKTLAYLGKESRGIYLFHFFFLPTTPFIKVLFSKILPNTKALSWDLLFVGGMTIWTILLTLLVIRVIKSSPILNMLLLGKEKLSTEEKHIHV